jgi:protein-ribulosamine 3-kinase
MIPKPVETAFLELITNKTGEASKILKASGLSGGCINDAARVETTAGVYFLKWNHAGRYPGMFASEARGLELLAAAGAVKVPGVTGQGEAGDHTFLALEYIEQGRSAGGFWQDFGQGLARLHQNTDTRFGLDHDNYIGSLPQSNRHHDSWLDFFTEERLEAQGRLARDSGRAGSDLSRALERMYPRLQHFFPEEPPALLHGDLWSGNYMTGSDGKAVIIDPAVYYGHRYMDLGMSKLFGGFSGEFYQHYHEAWPLDAGWRDGVEVANLYPLLVHVNLFGGGYLGSIMSTLKRYS